MSALCTSTWEKKKISASVLQSRFPIDSLQSTRFVLCIVLRARVWNRIIIGSSIGIWDSGSHMVLRLRPLGRMWIWWGQIIRRVHWTRLIGKHGRVCKIGARPSCGRPRWEPSRIWVGMVALWTCTWVIYTSIISLGVCCRIRQQVWGIGTTVWVSLWFEMNWVTESLCVIGPKFKKEGKKEERQNNSQSDPTMALKEDWDHRQQRTRTLAPSADIFHKDCVEVLRLLHTVEHPPWASLSPGHGSRTDFYFSSSAISASNLCSSASWCWGSSRVYESGRWHWKGIGRAGPRVAYIYPRPNF